MRSDIQRRIREREIKRDIPLVQLRTPNDNLPQRHTMVDNPLPPENEEKSLNRIKNTKKRGKKHHLPPNSEHSYVSWIIQS